MAYISPYSFVPGNDNQFVAPNMEFLSNVLQTKQQRYEDSYKKLSTLRHGYLNLDLLNDEDKTKLDNLNNDIKNWFDQNPNADYSDARIIQDLSSKFSTIADDPSIRQGLAETRDFRAQFAAVEESRKRKDFNAISASNVMFAANQYKNAKAGEARVKPHSYVPDCDYKKLWNDAAKTIKADVQTDLDPEELASSGEALSRISQTISPNKVYNKILGSIDECAKSSIREEVIYNRNNNPRFIDDIFDKEQSALKIQQEAITGKIGEIEEQLASLKAQGKTGEEAYKRYEILKNEYSLDLDNLNKKIPVNEADEIQLRSSFSKLNEEDIISRGTEAYMNNEIYSFATGSSQYSFLYKPIISQMSLQQLRNQGTFNNQLARNAGTLGDPTNIGTLGTTNTSRGSRGGRSAVSDIAGQNPVIPVEVNNRAGEDISNEALSTRVLINSENTFKTAESNLHAAMKKVNPSLGANLSPEILRNIREGNTSFKDPIVANAAAAYKKAYNDNTRIRKIYNTAQIESLNEVEKQFSTSNTAAGSSGALATRVVGASNTQGKKRYNSPADLGAITSDNQQLIKAYDKYIGKGLTRIQSLGNGDYQIYDQINSGGTIAPGIKTINFPISEVREVISENELRRRFQNNKAPLKEYIDQNSPDVVLYRSEMNKRLKPFESRDVMYGVQPEEGTGVFSSKVKAATNSIMGSAEVVKGAIDMAKTEFISADESTAHFRIYPVKESGVVAFSGKEYEIKEGGTDIYVPLNPEQAEILLPLVGINSADPKFRSLIQFPDHNLNETITLKTGAKLNIEIGTNYGQGGNLVSYYVNGMPIQSYLESLVINYPDGTQKNGYDVFTSLLPNQDINNFYTNQNITQNLAAFEAYLNQLNANTASSK